MAVRASWLRGWRIAQGSGVRAGRRRAGVAEGDGARVGGHGDPIGLRERDPDPEPVRARLDELDEPRAT